MLITDQVATAPCTDLFQARCPIFEAKHQYNLPETDCCALLRLL
jgi:hypothetical protein